MSDAPTPNEALTEEKIFRSIVDFVANMGNSPDSTTIPFGPEAIARRVANDNSPGDMDPNRVAAFDRLLKGFESLGLIRNSHMTAPPALPLYTLTDAGVARARDMGINLPVHRL